LCAEERIRLIADLCCAIFSLVVLNGAVVVD